MRIKNPFGEIVTELPAFPRRQGSAPMPNTPAKNPDSALIGPHIGSALAE
ncbi:hypothetical protein [Bradyrhizobium sp. sGM-13]|nr:hypothetical protein [Bradyrhizobium sp. sGM-13]